MYLLFRDDMCVGLLGMQLSGIYIPVYHTSLACFPKASLRQVGLLGLCWQFSCMHSTQDSGKIICHFTSSEMSDKTELDSNSFMNKACSVLPCKTEIDTCRLILFSVRQFVEKGDKHIVFINRM